MKNVKKWFVSVGFFCLGLTAFSSAWASSFEDFFAAVKHDDVTEIQRLAQRGFDLNTINRRGEHALFLAMRDDAVKVAGFLLDQPGVQVEVRTPNDESPLMMAALKGRLALATRSSSARPRSTSPAGRPCTTPPPTREGRRPPWFGCCWNTTLTSMPNRLMARRP